MSIVDNTFTDFIKKRNYIIELNGQCYKMPLSQYIAYFFIHVPGFFPGCEFRIIVEKEIHNYNEIETNYYSARIDFELFIKGEIIPITSHGKTVEDAIENLLELCTEYFERFDGKLQSNDIVFDSYDPDTDPNFYPTTNELEKY